MKNSIQLITKIITIFMLVLICLTLSCQQQDKEVITEAEVQIINDRLSEIWNKGKIEYVDQLYTPEIVRHDCGLPEDIVGLDALKNYFISNRTTFPDMIMTIDETIVKGNRIIWRWTITGTHTGPMGDIPPTAQKVKFSGVSIAHLVNGKIAEIWDFYNQAALLQQLGFTMVPSQH